jgi:hypothetical protein
MDLFVRKHQKKINGTLGCFDRMLFRGYLPIQSGWMMAEFLKQKQISFRDLKGFLIHRTDRINQYAREAPHRQFAVRTCSGISRGDIIAVVEKSA